MTASSLTDSCWRREWSIPDDVVYLNHGSFGPSPRCVQDAHREWTQRLEEQPMNFFLREMEEHLERVLAGLSGFVGTSRSNLVFVDNATFGMNIVAASATLSPGDEVLLNDHEYGAVTRIWKRRCREVDARAVICSLPESPSTVDSIVDRMFESVSERTRLIVVSHITSPTALVFPVADICRRARERDIAVCIDGPHALGIEDVNLKKLDCDFYTASCHKWLSAPFGSGLLFVHPRQQKHVKPAIVSWGGSVGGRQPSWKDEFTWLGTRDPSAFLAISEAIAFLSTKPLNNHGRELVRLCADRMISELGFREITADSSLICDTMRSLEFPKSTCETRPPTDHRDPLQTTLWERFRIEVPVVHWNDRRLLRVSSHLYNSKHDIDALLNALTTLQSEGAFPA